ncbi:hypothetical protein ACFVWY_34395 [Streptomyces sp. NPDC058195]|uniref:hypothetical protein n=1 Tax=Streptomyces sp. NPDC058195 TaxID=3346375 RepID=UPI0036EF6153
MRQEGRDEWADGPDWSATAAPEEPAAGTSTVARDTAESTQAIWAERTGALLSAGGG